MKNEFDIIETYFNNLSLANTDNRQIIKAVGDDCAIVKTNPKKQLVLSTDTLIEGVHFPFHTCAKDIATKALSVNLSDLAAMGAKPAWFTLAITLTKQCNTHWLKQFSKQLTNIANKHSIALIGGDTTHGNILSITIQVHGYTGKYPMMRSNAKVNDIILVSGKLGAAALGLKIALKQPLKLLEKLTDKQIKQSLKALNAPQAAISKGRLISNYCNCAIDISDGLLADLGHILQQSDCGAIVEVDKVPLANCLKSLEQQQAVLMALTGGDDYKLCVTLSKSAWKKLKLDCGGKKNTGFYPIGQICKKKGIRLKAPRLQNLHLQNLHLQNLHLQNNDSVFTSNNKKWMTHLDGKKLTQLSKGYNHFD